jgi:hypothetical protein
MSRRMNAAVVVLAAVVSPGNGDVGAQCSVVASDVVADVDAVPAPAFACGEDAA